MKIMNSTQEEAYFILFYLPRPRIELDPKQTESKLIEASEQKELTSQISSARSPLNCLLQVLIRKEELPRASPVAIWSQPCSSSWECHGNHYPLPESHLTGQLSSAWRALPPPLYSSSRPIPGANLTIVLNVGKIWEMWVLNAKIKTTVSLSY